MRETRSTFIDSRAETLAREFLTRRADVSIHAFSDAELDLVCTIYPATNSKAQGFMPFGIIVWGTDRPLPSEEIASRFVTKRWLERIRSSQAKPHFFIPVLALVFAVAEDVGYYSWISEPHTLDERPKLIANEGLDSVRIQRNSLDRIVLGLKDWYDRLASVLIVDA